MTNAILFFIAMVLFLFVWDATGYVYVLAASMLSYIGMAAAVYKIFKRKFP